MENQSGIHSRTTNRTVCPLTLSNSIILGSPISSSTSPPLSVHKARKRTNEQVDLNVADKSYASENLTEEQLARAKRLRARYGHVQPGADNNNLMQYQLHFKVDERAVNQGLCFFNAELNTYYMKSRKVCLPGQIPKELIIMDLEKPPIHLGHTHVEFYITGKSFQFVMITL